MNLPLHLRTYQPGDLALMYELDRVCFEPPFRFSRGSMREFAEAGNAIVRLACEPATGAEPERMVGFCIVHLERTREQRMGYVVTLDVAPGWRRRGVARALMQSTEAIAQGLGAPAVVLHVFSRNAAAIRLYEQLGYGYTRTEENFYGLGLDALLYAKTFTQGPDGA